MSVCSTRSTQIAKQVAEQAGAGMHDRDLGERVGEMVRSEHVVAREQSHARAAGQRQHDLEQADAEGVAGERDEHVVAPESVLLLGDVNVVREVGVTAHRPPWVCPWCPKCRARTPDHRA